jgi:hypothetical protein
MTPPGLAPARPRRPRRVPARGRRHVVGLRPPPAHGGRLLPRRPPDGGHHPRALDPLQPGERGQPRRRPRLRGPARGRGAALAAVRARRAARDARPRRPPPARPALRARVVDLPLRGAALRPATRRALAAAFLAHPGAVARGHPLRLLARGVRGARLAGRASLLAVGLFSVAYTTLGGIVADIWSDVVQLALLWAGTLLAALALLAERGTALLEGLPGGAGPHARLRLDRPRGRRDVLLLADAARRGLPLHVLLRLRPEPGAAAAHRPRATPTPRARWC